jgi:hypothetical protein
MTLIVTAVGAVAALGLAIRSWARATTWGLPRWQKPVERPLVCETCGRRFQYLTRDALPPGLESLGADGLLVLHVRAQHQQVPGRWYGQLPKPARAPVPRLPPERWHARRRELLTEEQWRARQLSPPPMAGQPGSMTIA